MGATTKPAPDAAVAEVATRRAVLAHLGAFKDFRGSFPLGDASAGHAVDRCGAILSQVSCLLSFMSAAYEDSDQLLNKGLDSEVNNRVGGVVAHALDGIQTLVGLASFLLDDGEVC